MARRKIQLEVIEPDEDTFALACDGHAILSGDGTINEDLVCGRCQRTLFMPPFSRRCFPRTGP
jgi:hypothetical protein